MEPATTVNRRHFFRVRLENHPVTLRVLSVAGRPADLPTVQGWLEDVSGGGCAVACDLDLPIRLGLVLEVEFQLGGESFKLAAEPVRKVDERHRYLYGLAFVDLTEGVRSRLIRELHRIEAEQRKRREAAKAP
ncbi:MAG: PilZ domain-containing protein [Bacillota bacterium]